MFLVLYLLSLLIAPLPAKEATDYQNWSPYTQREDLRPQFSQNNKYLRIASNGHLRSNGSWRKRFEVEGGSYYSIRGEYRAVDVSLLRRSILIKVDWIDSGGKRTGYPDYANSDSGTGGDWTLLVGTFHAPKDAVSAHVDLVFRWSATGSVEWKDVSFSQTAPPKRREITVATVNFRPSDSRGPEENLNLFGKFVEEAGEKGADIICLPEGITVVGTSLSYLEVAEPVPGPTTRKLGEYSKKYATYIVAGIYESVGKTVYNTAVLIDRQGNLVGRYRKVSLPREEIEGGLTPGDSFPVFDTDFGRLGILICWDIHFPEGARQLAAKGAELIFLPIWGGIELLFPARAVENQIYLVTSSFDATTGIWDRRGIPIGTAKENGEVVSNTIDLAETTTWEWLGSLRDRIQHESPPVREVLQ